MAEETVAPIPKKANYKPVFAVLGVVVIVAILLTPVNAFSSQAVSFIDTELKKDDGNHLMVNTKYPIGDKEKLEAFPKTMGKWSMTHEYDWDFIAELLDTDVLIARDYRAPGIYIPVSLVIIQSSNVSSFHPAPVCYKAQGFTIVDSETATVPVEVNNTAWAKQGVFAQDLHAFDGKLVAKRLVVEKEVSGGAKMRELNLYFYLKEEQGNVAQKIEWVRISMYVPATGDYSAHENILKEFMGEVVPELFAPSGGPPPATVFQILASKVGM